MKVALKLVFFVFLTSVLIFTGCAHSSAKEVKNDCIPDWVLKPPSAEDALYGIGQASKASQALAQKAADTRAIQSISEQVVSKVQTRVKDFLEEVGFASESEVNELTSSTVKILSQTTLEGARIAERGICNNTWYSLCEYKNDNAAKLIANTLKSEMEKKNLWTRFMANKEFEEMENDIKEAFKDE